MALQAGMGITRLLMIVGAGYSGTILLKNRKLSDIMGELQKLIKKYENGGEVESQSDDVSEQVRRLTEEMRRLSGRPVIINGNSGQDGLTASLLVPAAALGVLGYGYMWWKGISFSDLMYVTKHGMSVAVENLSKHLEHVSDVVAATKRHLTQRIENLDEKLDEQVEISKLIKSDVNDVRGDLSQINSDLGKLQIVATDLDGKLASLEAKQELTNTGVLYLCNFVNEKQEPGKMPVRLREQLKVVGSSVSRLMGLKDFEALESGSVNYRLITDGSEKKK